MKMPNEAYRPHNLINLWGQRKTLHMYIAGDWDMICDIYHDRTYIQNQLSLHQEFFEDIAEQVRITATAEKRITRSQIDAFVSACAPASLKENDFLTYMVLSYLSVNGVIFGIPAKPSIQEFACSSTLNKAHWQRDAEKFAASLDEMMRRYFRYYGPATMQDFSHWSGLPILAFREVFGSLEPSLTAATLDKRTYYSFGSIEVKNSQKLSMLGKFDPLFVSYCHKDWVVAPEQQKRIWRSAGHVEAVILDGVRLVGTWRHVRKGGRIIVCVEPLATISEGAKKRIEAKSKKLARFWGKELESVVYR